LGRVAQEDLRLRRVVLREVWRQAAGLGVRDGSTWGRAILEHLGLPMETILRKRGESIAVGAIAVALNRDPS
jgi:hypothetical protein